MRTTLRDRFYTDRTAKAMLSWRLLAGVAAAVVAVVLGLHWGISLVVGLAVYAALVLAAMPRATGTRPAAIDPFTISEPWRRFVTAAQRSGRVFHETVEKTAEGPLKQRLGDIVGRLDSGLAEVWSIANRGDQIDDAVRRLDPTALRAKLQVLEREAEQTSSSDVAAAASSVRAQLESADRLKALSAETVTRLRLTQTRLDELAARATEVSVGASDTDELAGDVDDLIVELESLRLAVDEIKNT